MENVSYIGMSQQLALRQKMDVVANNIANMNTTGFKGQSVLFLEYLNKAQGSNGPNDAIRQVTDYASYRDLAQGTLRQTGNKLDVAIEGDGYFAVQTPAGTRYTRDGGFSMNANRELVTKSGLKLVGDGGPIVIPPEASNIEISEDGTISGSQGEIGRLKLVTFDNLQNLREEGGNLFSMPGGAPEKPAEGARLVQGALEGSNVNPIVEMNKMMEILRSYQTAQKMIQSDHDRIRSAIQKLTSV